MNREAILARRAAIEARIYQEIAKRDEITSLLLTLDGGLQDCNYWIGVLDAQEAAAKKPNLREMPPPDSCPSLASSAK